MANPRSPIGLMAAVLAGAALFAGSVTALTQVRALGDDLGGLDGRLRAGQRRLERSAGAIDRSRARIEEVESAPAPDIDPDALADLSDAMDQTQGTLGILEEESRAAERALDAAAGAPSPAAVDPGSFPRLSALPEDQGAAIRAGVREVLGSDDRVKAHKRRELSVRKGVESLTERLALTAEQASGVDALFWAHLEALKAPAAADFSTEEHVRRCRQSLRDQVGRLLDERQAAEFEGVELPMIKP